MKTYNRSLDFVVLAMAQGRKGNTTMAAKLFAKAIAEPDCVRAVAILEASNKQAYAVQAAASKAKKVEAAKRVQASDEFDVGDDTDLEDLVTSDEMGDDAGDEGDDVEGLDEEVEASEEDEDDEGFDEQFASVLASMKKKDTKARK